jgi:amino acid adenylation domain-containing protein
MVTQSDLKQQISVFPKEDVWGSIPERFEKQVSLYPNQLAMKYGDISYTYAELNSSANQLARGILANHGNGEVPVAFLLEHGTAQIVAILGILKAGKFYVPLDASFPLDRIAYMFEDSQAGLLITNGRNLEKAQKIAQGRTSILNLDRLDGTLNPENLDLSICCDSFANVLYTSGSTGEAKGVIQNHRNLLHGIWSITNSYNLTPEDRFALLFSSSYAASVTPILGSLLNGATLFPFDLKNNLAFITNWLIEEKITIYISVPTLFRHFASSLTGVERFSGLRLIIIGGEPVIYKDVELFQHYFEDHCKMVVRLAGTEMHRVRFFVIEKDTIIEDNVVPVGYPVEDKDVSLVDENGNLVGSNEVGEILVKSRFISPGYWRKPLLTAEKFIPDPEDSDIRIFRTGDLGRINSDGCLYHLGRKDFLVKIRGFRIELEEIEAILGRHPDLRESVVVVDERDGLEKRLIAYYVPSTQRQVPSRDELRAFLEERLPDYMIPAIFVLLDEMPLTPTGKVNRRALPKPEKITISEDKILAPRNEIEVQLVKIWEEVLGVHPVGIKDDFFKLGGHSLLAARTIAQVEKTFDCRLHLTAFTEEATIEKMAEIIQNEDSVIAIPSVVQLQPQGNKPPFFCVHGVGGHVVRFKLLSEHMSPDHPFYALQSRGLDGLNSPFIKIEEMAAFYIDEIQNVQPAGPYLLGGFSFGGFVAYEIARQLLCKGKEVALVALLDTRASKAPRFSASLSGTQFLQYNLKNLAHKTGFHLDNMRRLPVVEMPGYLVKRKNNPIPQDNFVDETIDDPSLPVEFREVMAANNQALNAYVPGRYSGKVTLFKSIDHGRGIYYGWGNLAEGGVKIYEVPGTHTGIIEEPNVQVLADLLKESIDLTISG